MFQRVVWRSDDELGLDTGLVFGGEAIEFGDDNRQGNQLTSPKCPSPRSEPVD